MTLELKIKRITLAAEARGIKVNVNRIRRKLAKLHALANVSGKHALAIGRYATQRDDLARHRLDVVRPEARAMHLAHNFLVGRAYFEVEPISHFHFRTATFDAAWTKLWERVEYHVLRHAKGDVRTVKQEFTAWHDDAKSYARKPDMQVPAREAARAGSLAAKAARLALWKAKRQ